MQNKKLNFIPSLHGFAFANRFPGYILPSCVSSFPGISNFLSSSQSCYGLCGGMCFAAYDFFNAQRTITSNNTIPKPGSPLYRYLYKRQLDSYGQFGKLIAKFAHWTVLSDSTVDRLTYYELNKVATQIENGQAVILGLVYTSIAKTIAIWLNHQVLAYNYLEEAEAIKIKIYDPNFPYQDDIIIEIKSGSAGIKCTQKIPHKKKEVHIRGFFVIPYIPIEPPII